jgi:hypothetical protein
MNVNEDVSMAKSHLLGRASPVPPYLAFAVAAAAAIGCTVALGLGASRWIGETFPGFFVLPNRVVASVGRLDWPSSRSAEIYQSAVEAVGDTAVGDSASVYRRVAGHPPATAFRYQLRRGLRSEAVSVPAARFTREDFVLLFGSYLATGLLYLLAGLLGGAFLANRRLASAVLAVGGIGGVYALSAVAIYDPNGDLTLHALAEALLPAGLVHLAVALSRREGPAARAIVATGWWLSVALAIPYLLLLQHPTSYSPLHAACETYVGVAGAGVVVCLLTERARRGEAMGPLEKAALAGAFLGLGIPAVVVVLSGLTGGVLPVNLMTATAFLFPLALGWGVFRERSTFASGALAAEPLG